MTIILKCGDVIEQLKELPDDSVDAIVTDPPYNLAFMGKKWDTKGTPKEFEEWTHAWATECLRVLRSGGHLLSFGGTRTFHRMTSGIENAGFSIKDCLSWNYSSGFPKSNNFLKPAWEPIVLAQRPFKGTIADNILIHGVGGLNVNDCRIGTEIVESGRKGRSECQSESYGKRLMGDEGGESIGRWPANVIFDEEVGAILDSQNDSISRFFYCSKSPKRERTCLDNVENKHPTVKPLKLMEHLISLVCPTAEAMGRTPVILDCFVGSGSTAIAAHRLGVDCIGIDIDAESLETARLRLENDWRLEKNPKPIIKQFEGLHNAPI